MGPRMIIGSGALTGTDDASPWSSFGMVIALSVATAASGCDRSWVPALHPEIVT